MRHLFFDDYSEGAHPAILEAFATYNDGQEMGYGEDGPSRIAAERIAASLGREDAAVHLLSGGTQANIVCLSALLRHHEAVIAATSGHINVHEAGSIEAAGHKILGVASDDGKLTPGMIDSVLATNNDEHTVRPRAVYISQATEFGTVYSDDELSALTSHAHGNNLVVFMDGARLAMAVAAHGGDSLADVGASGVDILYIGGTKNGALFGEAVAIINPDLQRDFRHHLKQRGALLAKGRALGAQFARFFDADGLWFELGRTANASADRMSRGLTERGVALLQPREVNQVFAILGHDVIAKLRADFGFHTWAAHDADHDVVRIVCSWATPDDAVDAFLAGVSAAL